MSGSASARCALYVASFFERRRYSGTCEYVFEGTIHGPAQRGHVVLVALAPQSRQRSTALSLLELPSFIARRPFAGITDAVGPVCGRSLATTNTGAHALQIVHRI